MRKSQFKQSASKPALAKNEIRLESLESRRLLANAVAAVLAPAKPAMTVDANYVQPGKFLYRSGGYLTNAVKNANPLNVAMGYLTANAAALGLKAADVTSSIVTDQYTDADTGITHIYLRQTFNGMEIQNTDMTVTVMRDGRVLSAGGTFVPGVGTMAAQPIAPGLTAAAALKKAAGNLNLKLTKEPVQLVASRGLGQVQKFGASEISVDDIPAQLHYVATSTGLQLAWDFIVNVPGGQHWFDTNVNSTTGKMLWTNDFVDNFADPAVVAAKLAATKAAAAKSGGSIQAGGVSSVAATSDSYNVYARPNQSPSTGGRTSQVNPWDLAASPFGWQDENGIAGDDSNVTHGNNVYAQDDANANNGTDGLTPSGGTLGTDLNFDFPIDLTQAPSVYRSAAITNLYYWNNILHDVHYKYGFTEAARNFQKVNYSGLGSGNDFVWADAQDGVGTNNANFSTPADGGSGRMQMFIFTAPTPDRDGDLDAQVMIHEYGHGVSNRLSGNGGGLNALQSIGMGEGWGDWWSLMLTQTDGSVAAQNAANPVGTYVLAQPLTGAGIRRQPYSYNMSINNQTLATYMTNTSDEHAIGELWTDVLWDMNWNLIRKYGFNANVAQGFTMGDSPTGNGNLLALRLVMDALKIQPTSPSFLEARNAILAADQAINGGQDLKEIWQAFARRGWGVNAVDASASATTVTENFEVPPALFDPYVINNSPAASFVDPAFSKISFNFEEAMNPGSFSTASDITSFTGPGAVDLTSQITGFAWSNSNKTLTVNFNTQVAIGSYSMTIGPNILAADDNHPMDQNIDGVNAQPNDSYTASVTLTDRFPGPDAGGYEASPVAFQNINLVIGQPGVTTVVNATDDNPGTITLPAGNTFRFYGTNYTTMSASANGFIAFGGTASTTVLTSDFTTTPTTATIAPALSDWMTNANAAGGTDSTVLWQIVGSDLIVEWSDVPHWVTGTTGTSSGVTFQAIMHLNTGAGNGDIVFNYPDLITGTAGFDNAATTSVGIKAAGTQGTSRILISQNKSDSAFVQQGKAIRFTATAATGTVFADDNGNGVQDGGEAPIAGAFVYNDSNNNGVYDAATEMSATSDGSGNYKITSLVDGAALIVRSSIGATWIETQPTPTTFPVAQGLTATGANIGVFNTTIAGTAGTDTYTVRQNAAQDRVEVVVGGTPTYSILKSVLPTLRFESNSGSDVLTVDFANGNPVSTFSNRLQFVGTGNVTLAASGAGTLNVDPAQETDTPHLELFATSGATMNLFNGMRVDGIILNSGNLTLTAGATRPLVTHGLGMVGSSVMDLFDNDMVVYYTGVSPLGTIVDAIRTARNGNAWNGLGITSTSAKLRVGSNTTLGAMDFSNYTLGSSFSGETIVGTAVIVKYTYYGDANFNGKVQGDDYGRIDSNFNQQHTAGNIGGWNNGDFNGDGKIDGADYGLIDSAFNSQLEIL